MDNIAIILYEENKNKLFKKVDYYYTNILGKTFLKICILKNKKSFKTIKKILIKEQISGVVLYKDAIAHTEDIKSLNLCIFDGKYLMSVLITDLIKNIASFKDSDYQNTRLYLYTDKLNRIMKEMVIDLTSVTKFINIISSDKSIYKFADDILTKTGIALSLGDNNENEGISIIDSDIYKKRDIMINLGTCDIKDAVNGIIFTDESGNDIPFTIAEAALNKNISKDEFYKLNLKFKCVC